MPPKKRTETSVSIPVAGDKEYRDTVHLLAYRRKTTAAQLVRAALDAAYGTELEWLNTLRTESVASKQHSTPESER